jgi:pimeloyl-ACP methyl ester carboxylesterase
MERAVHHAWSAPSRRWLAPALRLLEASRLHARRAVEVVSPPASPSIATEPSAECSAIAELSAWARGLEPPGTSSGARHGPRVRRMHLIRHPSPAARRVGTHLAHYVAEFAPDHEQENVMSAGPSSPGRRRSLVTSAAASALGVFLLAVPGCSRTVSAAGPSGTRDVTQSNEREPRATGTEVRAFRVHVPEADLVDLRRRIAATRWPDRETVTDQSQGVKLAKLQELVRYWGTEYDWRKAEARLNALPQFVTNIDGLDIQFIHVRSRHPNAMPMIMTHGWPGSPFEVLNVIGPLTDPTAHGGRAEDAFHLVLPTYPGYGFSGKPQGTDWKPDHVARAWDVLMKRLGYTRYVSQGGDWGAIISQVMAVQAPEGLLGIHTNMPGTVPSSVLRLIRNRDPVPSGFSDAEKVAYAGLDAFYRTGFGYADLMNTRPQTLGYSLADSPVGMAAFYYDKFAAWTQSGGEPERVVTRDEILDNITLYWLTNTGTSSSRSYWDAAQLGGGPFNAVEITKVPVAVTVFPGEIYRAPRSWGERTFHKLIYWHEVDKGGHFAAWEQPELFASELRAAFRTLR